MTSRRNIVVEAANLTDVWLATAEHLVAPSVNQLTHFEARLVGFDGSRPDEFPSARRPLDDALRMHGPCDTNATANLIFPESAWAIARARGQSPDEFFAHYHTALMPRLRRQDRRNGGGTYFDRMVAYPTSDGPVNQLAKLLGYWGRGTRRQSAFQVLIYQPTIDLHGRPYMGFPCLDYIAFTREGGRNLVMSAFYASQLIFERAFGNYLGLCRLGAFMAEQMGLTLVQVSCHVGVATLGGEKITKAMVGQVIEKMRVSMRGDIARKAA